MLRQKLPGLRRHSLKETPTRTIIIDPLLEAFGWEVRDPDEVQLEHPTVDGKSVDYALKLNKKPVLPVEAKAMDDSLDDVKAVTQVVGYANNDGIVWCILTNGIKWRVYRSVEKCPAPDKLMFDVSLDPDASEGMTVEQIAKKMWRFSRDEMVKGTLDALGEQTFTDGKVRKALQALMVNPPFPEDSPRSCGRRDSCATTHQGKPRSDCR
jgi:predicted type IV restriction endonuclease